jgi:hypothetical protein
VTVIKSSVFMSWKNFRTAMGKLNACIKNREFQTVCEDYRQCAEALHHWNQSHEKEAPIRRQEYAQLFQELMDEICLYLNESV